jgi:uncharacterized phage protein (predicted DNA packaging)
MKYITLDEIKKFSRIEGSDEDEVLEMMGNAAEEQVLRFLNRTYEDLLAQYGAVPVTVKSATLSIVDMQYQYRSLVSPTQLYFIPYSIDMKLLPYKALY